jgi:hypothetical protein
MSERERESRGKGGGGGSGGWVFVVLRLCLLTVYAWQTVERVQSAIQPCVPRTDEKNRRGPFSSQLLSPLNSSSQSVRQQRLYTKPPVSVLVTAVQRAAECLMSADKRWSSPREQEQKSLFLLLLTCHFYFYIRTQQFRGLKDCCVVCVCVCAPAPAFQCALFIL